MIFPLRDLIHPLQTNLVISRTKSSVIFLDSRDVDGALGTYHSSQGFVKI